MLVQIGNWLYQNAMAIFISAIASLLISKRYYDKANRESVLMMVIFPIVKLLNEKYYTRNDYEALFEINSSYAVKYLRKKERNKLLELLSAYRDVCKYSKENADISCIMAYYNYKLKEKGMIVTEYDKPFFDQVLALDSIKELYKEIDQQVNGLGTTLQEELENYAKK